jgi:hypothetical protein
MTELSPAAQAVLTAYHKEAIDYIESWSSFSHKRGIAAALRAAADQVVPAFITRPSTRTGLVKLNIRNRLQSLADELEGRDATTIRH